MAQRWKADYKGEVIFIIMHALSICINGCIISCKL